ncbi:hypothetical protein [Serratia fonticola]|nr:hypothetical protein [Serratia fonticola]
MSLSRSRDRLALEAGFLANVRQRRSRRVGRASGRVRSAFLI